MQVKQHAGGAHAGLRKQLSRVEAQGSVALSEGPLTSRWQGPIRISRAWRLAPSLPTIQSGCSWKMSLQRDRAGTSRIKIGMNVIRFPGSAKAGNAPNVILRPDPEVRPTES